MKPIAKVSIFLAGLCTLAVLVGCGTDSGNPGATPVTSQPALASDFIGPNLCSKLQACFAGAPSDCATRLLTAANLSAGLGVNASVYPTLQSVLAAVSAGALSAQEADKATCQQALAALSCSSTEVNQAYDPASPNDLSQTYHLLSASSACQSMVR